MFLQFFNYCFFAHTYTLRGLQYEGIKSIIRRTSDPIVF